MSTQLQTLIDQANRRTAGARRKQFVKRSSEGQMLEHLVKNVRMALDLYHLAYRNGLDVDNNLRAALREMETALVMAEKRLEQ